MRARPTALSVLTALVSLALPAGRARAAEFWPFWGDGKAELDGYALVEPRYGQPRKGTAVLIFVTEDFSDSARVKADPSKHPPSDVYPVLKLNFVRDFQTGIYDYNLLTSVFARIDNAFAPVKISFSSQEWCGHVYTQWLARTNRLEGTMHSYFDGEGDRTQSLPFPAGGVLEEALPILLRGLKGDYLAPGGTRTVPFLPSTMRARFAHKPQSWGEATITRSASTSTVQTALGSVEAFTYSVEEKGGEKVVFALEQNYPHRVLSWSSSSGESGTLLGSARLAYWTLNGEGGESYLKQIGLAPPVPPGLKTKR